MDSATQVATPESSTGAPVTDTTAAGGNVAATEGTATPEQVAAQAATTAPTPEMLSIMGTQIEKAKVHPELLGKLDQWNKDYTQKSQDYSKARKQADVLEKLTQYPAFQKWYYEQTNPQARQTQQQADPFELTAERQAELLADPKSFRSYVEGVTTDIVQRIALPAAQQAQREARSMRNEHEVSRLAGMYEDFDQLNNNGKIEAVQAKYASKNVEIDLEDAYWLAKRSIVESEAQVRAHQRVQDKVAATTLPPGGAAPSQVKVVPAKGMPFEDRMRLAAAAAYRGEKIQFDLSR